MVEKRNPWYIMHQSQKALGDHLMTVLPPAAYLHEIGATEVRFSASRLCQELVMPELPRATILTASEEKGLNHLRLVARKIMPYPIINLLRFRHNIICFLREKFLKQSGYSVLNISLLFRKKWQEIHQAHTAFPEGISWTHRVGLSFEAFPPEMRPSDIKDDWTILHFSKVEIQEAKRVWKNLLNSSKCPPVILNPVGQKPFYRRWPICYWRQLAEDIRKDGYPIVLLGGTHPELAREISNGLTFAPHILAIDDASGIRIFASMLSQAAIVITVDSGVSHIASAAGATVLALHGPTDPRFCGPYSHENGKTRSIRAETAFQRNSLCAVNCANAFSSSRWSGCKHFPEDPENELLTHGGCMHLINTDLVIETAREMLKE